MSRQKLRVVVGLITGHNPMFKLRLTQRRDCRVCRDKIEGSVHNVSLSSTGMQKIQNLRS